MKKLCRFYCCDCDHAWLEIIEENKENPDYHDKCDYCGRQQKAEEIEGRNENY